MQCKEPLYEYEFHPGFQVNIDQLLANEPGWSWSEEGHHFVNDHVLYFIGDYGFRSSLCLPEQMQNFIETVKRYPKTAKTQEETLKIIRMMHQFIFQDCDEPFIKRPQLYDSVRGRQNPNGSDFYRLNNVSTSVRGPFGGSRQVWVMINAGKRRKPDFDENWRLHMQIAKKTLFTAIAGSDMLDENPED